MNTNKLQPNQLNQNESNVKIRSPHNSKSIVYQQNKIPSKSLFDSLSSAHESNKMKAAHSSVALR